MRLLYISLEFLEPIYSGNGALARMQVDELLKQGQHLLVMCGNELGKDKQEPERENLTVIPVIIQSSRDLGPNADFFGFSFGIIEQWAKIKAFNPDALIVDDWHSAMASIALGEGLEIPIFYQYFRIFSREARFFSDPYQFKQVRALEQKLSEKSKYTIHLCNDTAEWANYTFKVSTYTIYPAIKPTYLKIADEYLANSNYSINYPIKLVTFIRISPEKEIERLINLVKHFSFPFRLLILGEVVNQEYKQQIDALVQNSALMDKIEFEGRFTTESLIKKLLECHIYIHPSRYEPFGISIMEAAYLGLPIVLDNSPKIGAGELLIDGDSCLKLDYDSPEDSAKRMKQHVQDSDQLKTIGKNGQKIAQSLKVELAIKKLLDLIGKSIKKN